MSTFEEQSIEADLISETEKLGRAIRRHHDVTLGYIGEDLDPGYAYRAVALALRDRLVPEWRRTRERVEASDCRKVSYFSLEFLIGRSLTNAVACLQLDEVVRDCVHNLGISMEELAEKELDAGLGNGGLGRLAACFLDSCANLQYPVTGYGIRYEYGMFHQQIEDGRQVEAPDQWLRNGNPWEFERPESAQKVRFYGRFEEYTDEQGNRKRRVVDTMDVSAVPYDMPIPGADGKTVNTLRLWKATATDAFNLAEFNAGGYTEAVAAKTHAEKITMVLYPNDASENGKLLRLKQQYFLVSASLQDIVSNWVAKHGPDFTDFADQNVFQLNDTHPACAVPELMRILIDEYNVSWDDAWAITRRCVAYTNHTLLPEALEQWSVAMFGRLLPRLLEIVFEINHHFLQEVEAQWPGDLDRIRRMSLIDSSGDARLRMAYLSIVGSYSVNGVAELHTKLLREGLFSDFNELWPDKFNNKTNGVTHRRWLVMCNPKQRELIDDVIGSSWHDDFAGIADLMPFAEDASFRERWRQVKAANKRRLANYVERVTGIALNEAALFDVQVKRIHEYKRQLLNVLHVIHLYDRIKRGEAASVVPRCVMIGGKAAPGYVAAKSIIKLINNVASIVNRDPDTDGLLQLVFVPNYRVSVMELICPAAELSEQISTAGKEASGTGNMKFMMNGAITIGTLDGANIEIREMAGEENFFLFGLDAAQVQETRKNYQPHAIIQGDADIQRVIKMLEEGQFSRNEPGIFNDLINGLKSSHDPWLTLADLRSYIDTQALAAAAYQDHEHWNAMSIRNTATSSKFTSDRTIREYAEDI
ncbi:MAG: glycogen/starch/alpha-glucan phosphorylase, partial [Planctomycetales bacterium]|nr:glycogen/starch/alpha-glucan phosphorylase [Planctomycetales bacterium]